MCSALLLLAAVSASASPLRFGSSMIVRGTTMYCFGGSVGVNASSEITMFRDGKHRVLPVSGPRPLGRMFHSAFYQIESDQMFVAGGVHCRAQFKSLSDESKVPLTDPLQDIWVFNFRSMRWSVVGAANIGARHVEEVPAICRLQRYHTQYQHNEPQDDKQREERSSNEHKTRSTQNFTQDTTRKYSRKQQPASTATHTNTTRTETAITRARTAFQTAGRTESKRQSANNDFVPVGSADRYFISSITPLSGPLEGGTLITVTGVGFVPQSPSKGGRSLLLCRFGSLEVAAQPLSTTVATCRSPQAPSLARSGAATVGRSICDAPTEAERMGVTMLLRFLQRKILFDVEASDGSGHGKLYFSYLRRPEVSRVVPNGASAIGGTRVMLQGQHFTPVHISMDWCRSVQNFRNQPRCELTVRFGTHDRHALAPMVKWISDTSVEVVVPHDSEGQSGSLVPVEISTNRGIDFSDSGVLFFYEPAVSVSRVRWAQPALGEHEQSQSLVPTGGRAQQRMVVVSGSNFVQTFPSTLYCRFIFRRRCTEDKDENVCNENSKHMHEGTVVGVATAIFVNETQMKCVAPSLASSAADVPNNAEVEVEITIDGEHYTENRRILRF